jgi:hypothetical protein
VGWWLPEVGESCGVCGSDRERMIKRVRSSGVLLHSGVPTDNNYVVCIYKK